MSNKKCPWVQETTEFKPIEEWERLSVNGTIFQAPLTMHVFDILFVGQLYMQNQSENFLYILVMFDNYMCIIDRAMDIKKLSRDLTSYFTAHYT